MENLRLVVEAIQADAETRATFLRPSGRSFIPWRGKLAQLRLSELEHCFRWGTWGPSDDDGRRAILHHIGAHLEAKATLDTVCRRILKSTNVPLERFSFAVEVTGLQSFNKPLQIGSFVFGPGALLLDDQLDRWPTILTETEAAELKTAMVVRFDGWVPRKGESGDWAWNEAQRALNLLAISYLRRWEETGPAWNLEVGLRGLTWRGRNATLNFRNEWWAGHAYGVVHDWLEARERSPQPPGLRAKGLPRFRTRIDGFTSMKPGPLRDDVTESFNALGLAVRMLPVRPASVSLAWAALERAYHLKRQRRPASVASCLLLAAASGGSFPDPAQLANLYDTRNAAVHEGDARHWTSDLGQKTLGVVYGQLEALVEYCLDAGISTRKQLESALHTAANLAAAHKWADNVRSNLSDMLPHVVHPEVKAMYERSVRLWEQVCKLLTPPA